jgi:acetyl-CoA carboxylase biotin carboxyl carrier protein
MIDLAFVESLIRALDESSLDSLELERGGTRVRLSKTAVPIISQEPPPVAHDTAATAVSEGNPASSPAPVGETVATAEESPAGKYVEVTSPMVGTFYRAPAPDAPPYVEVGSAIGEGTVLCIIEAMKLMNELESEVTGTIAKIMVENAEPVEFGQVLFLVDPS